MAKIGDTFYEIQHFSADEGPEGRGFLAKVTVEDPANYNISADVATGELKFTPKPKYPVELAAEPAKYRLEKEGDLFRVWALQRIIEHGVFAGDRGGLVASHGSLSQKGHCWIADGSKVLDSCYVSGDALVTHDSILKGACHIQGKARVVNSTLEGDIHISNTSSVVDSKLSTPGNGEISLASWCTFDDSIIETKEVLNFGGCRVTNGFIRRQHEVVSYWTSQYGWMSAYPNINGEPTFAVGCQARDGFDGIRELAGEYGFAGGHNGQMLDAFLALVEVAQRSWTPASKSGQDSELVPAEEPVPATEISMTAPPAHIVDY